jgi:hypothetical protein
MVAGGHRARSLARDDVAVSKRRITALVSRERLSGVTRSRFVSPTGFVLVLLCFLLPFAAVSCEQPNARITGEYTGSDFVVGGEPSFEVEGEADKPTDAEPVDVEPLAIATVLLILAGVGVAAAPILRVRLLGGLAAGGLAAIGLVANQLVVIDSLVDKVASSDAISEGTAEDMVETRLGFWLALALLIVVTGSNAAGLLLQRRSVPQPAQVIPPASAPGPAPAGDPSAWPPEATDPPGPPKPS